MALLSLTNSTITVRQFVPLVWKVQKGSWNLNFLWMWLSEHGFLDSFNEMSAEEQYEFLVAEFGED